jgi:endonuclease/exonuclease/phosphatase family metal-dependent hydrolase
VTGRAPLTVLTWNLQGRTGVDVDEVAQRIRAFGPDLVALQEVSARHARGLGRALAYPHLHWCRKHWPILGRAEGVAMLAPRPFLSVADLVLRDAPFWSWRRRVAVVATVAVGTATVAVANAHLTPHGDAGARAAELERLAQSLAAAEVTARVLVGDLNAGPTDALFAPLRGQGWRDAWGEQHRFAAEPAGATNWTRGRRAGRPPTQRLDHVLVGPELEILDAFTIDPEAPGFEVYTRLSDHLPVVARLALRSGRSTPADGGQQWPVHTNEETLDEH